MTSVLLDGYLSKEGSTSVHQISGRIRSILEKSQTIIQMPHDSTAWSDDHLHEWLQQASAHCNVFIGTSTRVIQTLKQLHWGGTIVYMVLGDLPRGASGLRMVLPYLNGSDIVWCTSEADKQIYENLVKRDDHCPEIRLIPFAIDTDRFKPYSADDKKEARKRWGMDADEIVLTYVGRITIEKNVHTVLELFKQLDRTAVKVKLLLIGTIDAMPVKEFNIWPTMLEKKFTTRIAELGSAVQHIPWLEPSELVDIYNCSDIFVNLTLNHDENFGLSQVEAMSCGLPVIGTAWGGLKDVVHPSCGVLADTWVTDYGIRLNSTTVVSSLRHLIVHNDVRAELAQQARERAVRYYSVAALEQAINKLIADASGRSRQEGVPAYTQFGEDFHQRFSMPSPSTSVRTPSFPVYSDASDPYYQTIIRPYTSKPVGDSRFEPHHFYYQALAGSVKGSYFVSDDFLWTRRIPLADEEILCLRLLSRHTLTPGLDIAPYASVIPSLIRKGLAGEASATG